jgi:hypothetical protein
MTTDLTRNVREVTTWQREVAFLLTVLAVLNRPTL